MLVLEFGFALLPRFPFLERIVGQIQKTNARHLRTDEIKNTSVPQTACRGNKWQKMQLDVGRIRALPGSFEHISLCHFA